MKAYGITDKGKVRQINQDSFLFNIEEEQDRAVAVLCDGMGGERAGEVASELAAGAFMEHALKSFTLSEIPLAVDIAKESSKKLTDIRRDKIGLIFQQFHMVNYLTAVENVMVSQYYHSMPDEQEALEALGRVGLRERAHHLPSQLSGGEQQRVCVARALINHPELILADEPTGNLDEANENIVLDLFAQLHAEGTTLIVVTHDPEVADAAQRTIVLEHGKVAREVINEHFDEQQKEWLARLKTENKR